MLTQKQILEIREHLNNSQNPLFFFDNDQDGLCSFLLLKRAFGKGKCCQVKSDPLNKDYFRKVNELNPDYIFILDVPMVSDDFWKEVEKINLPVVWIDHHTIDVKDVPSFVNYFNPFLNREEIGATTFLCYQVSKKKEDLWLAIVGCISDKYLPEYYKDFFKLYPDLAIDSDDAFEIFYNSQIGKIAQIMGSGLKDRTTNVMKMINFLSKAKNPYDVLEESNKNQEMHQRFKEVNKKFEKIFENAKKAGENSGKLLFFEYTGDVSMSSEISNKLKHVFSDKIVFVAYVSGAIVNVSGRGEGVKKILENALKDFEGAVGGGHENAVGAKIPKQDFEKFKDKVKELAE